MQRLTQQVIRAITIIFVGLLIATSLPAGGHLTSSAAVSQPATEATLAALKVFFEPTQPTQVAPAGAQPFAVILCRFADRAETWQTVADFEKLLFGPEGVDAYWREASYGRISLAGSRVVGWHTLPRPASAYWREDGSDVDLYRLAADCAAAADADIYFPDYFGIGLAFNVDLQVSSRGGKACLELDGPSKCYGAFWLWPANSHNRSLVAHEIGHAFGLRHSTALDPAEFGNAWDVMSQKGQWWPDPSYDPLPQHMIAYNKDLLGCIAADRKFVATAGEQTITLERLALPGPDGYLWAQIPIDGSITHFYTAEARQRVGFDRRLPNNAVVIHEVDMERKAPAMLMGRPEEDARLHAGSMWRAGQRFTDDEHGLWISVDAETPTGFIVTIFLRRPL